MGALMDDTTLLGVAVALASVVLLADGVMVFGKEAGPAPAGDGAMQSILGRTTRPVRSHPGLFFGLAAAVALAFLMIGERPLLGGMPRPAPPPSPCLMSGSKGFVRLGSVSSLENCGAQLEAIYLENGEPVAGAYNGLRLFVDDQGIDTAQPHGPRERLIAPWMRVQIDTEIRRLIRVRDGETLQIGVVRPRG